MNQLKGDQMRVAGEERMKKNISNEDTNLIAVYDGALYEYHDESWYEIEFQSTDDELEGDRLNVRDLYKDTTEPKSIPKFIITTSELPRVTPGDEAWIQRLMRIPFSTENETKDVTKEC